MMLRIEERRSDAPYVELVTGGQMLQSSQVIRPAETHPHMVFARYQDNIMPYIVGPLTASGNVTFTAGAEVLWVRLKAGTFFSHLPMKQLRDTEQQLPGARSNTFWLKSDTWEIPTFENVDCFIQRLIKEEILVHDPLVNQVLAGHTPDLSPRTIRHRFLQSAGLSQKQFQQMQRAQQAQIMLQNGMSILDTVFETGYYDQPHLTRSLKQYIGHTPAEIQAFPVSG